MTRLLAVSCVLLAAVCAHAQRSVDIQHYRFQIGLEDRTDTITGQASIDVVFLQPASQLVLDLVSLKSGKGMTVTGVTSSDAQLASVHRNDSLFITLPRSVQPGEKMAFRVSYRGIPADGLIISKNKFGHRTFFSDNWPNRARNWIPCVDDPADKASVEFLVTAPAHYQVVSNGLRVEESTVPGDKKLTHWKETVPLPTKVMVIGAADFAMYEAGSIGCVAVTNWVFPENREQSVKDYASASGILEFFSDYIGPYPYKKLANVQSKTIFGGMENASAIFYFENSVNGRQDQEGLIAHEIAHQWFGNMATEKSFAHLWLSEGFATYMTICYLEKKYGADTALLLRATDRQQVIAFAAGSDRPVVDSVSSYMSLLNANSYQKGGWVLHMLRRQLGDAAFQKAVRQYYAQYAGKNADTRDLQQVFEKVSAKDLSVFFRQWLYTPGLPKLELQWKYSTQEKKINVTVKQLQPDVFRFPLELSIQLAGRTLTETIQVTEALQTFSIPVRDKPLAVQADPGVNLLFDGSLKEMK
ncbi:MAG: M1 family metallopeptidase [Chitinophagaceae bacterium]